MDCWEVTSTWVNTKLAVVSPAKKKVVKEDSPRPRKKTSEEVAAEASEEAAAEATVEKKVGITAKRKETSSQNTTSPPKPTLDPGSESVNGMNSERKSLAEDKDPDVPAAVPADASSSKDKTPEPSLVLLDKNQPTVLDLQKEDARYQEKRDAALALCRAKSDRTRKLAASQQSPYTANITARVIVINKKLYPGYNPFAPIDNKKLKELADWLKTCPHYRTPLDKKPRKSRTLWYQILRTSLEWLEDCVWGTDIDDIYVPVNYADTHWIAMWISIPKRHIVVFDSICSSICPKELDVVMEPFLYMVPYLLVECASSDEQRAQYSIEPFTYERPTNIPPARAGDCGVYTLKYIECHALGIEFRKKYFAKANGKTMRDKMAVDIFQELPNAHELENKDMDDILGTYDG
uniref:Ubiquitin-like protease family profile domain-containing protein n=1 Tax=Brassica oleracea var. oleracea TaxID=109376 RepID=A0A0D3AB64_BRAOL